MDDEARKRLDRAMLRDRLVLPALAIGSIALCALGVWGLNVLGSYKTTGHVTARVIRTADTSSDTSFGLLVHAELPGKDMVTATTSSLAIAMSVVETACLRIQQNSRNATRYFVAESSRCDASGGE